jgi:adenosine deaminase
VLARLAARYVDQGVVGFGLSNDERRGRTADFAPAFAIAERAGLLLAPHGGELLGAESAQACLDNLHAGRLGHGVRASEDPELLDRIAQREVTLEVCPCSNVSLGVYPDLAAVPLKQLASAGVRIALGADDPLLFGSRLVDQYTAARNVHGFDDAAVANLARGSILGSRAPESLKATLLDEIAIWESDTIT